MYIYYSRTVLCELIQKKTTIYGLTTVAEARNTFPVSVKKDMDMRIMEINIDMAFQWFHTRKCWQ